MVLSHDGDELADAGTETLVQVSRARLLIMDELIDRPKTVSELARQVGMSKGPLHRHLRILVEAGYVERRESDRLWVYYFLSERGRRVRRIVRTSFLVVTGLGSLLTLIGVVVLLAARRAPSEKGLAETVGQIASDAAPILVFFLAAGFAVFLGLFVHGMRRRRDLSSIL